MSKYHCASCGIPVNDSNGVCYAFPSGDEALCNACDAQDIVAVNAPVGSVDTAELEHVRLAFNALLADAGVKLQPGKATTLTNEQIAKLFSYED